jgi:hypothetical protein
MAGNGPSCCAAAMSSWCGPHETALVEIQGMGLRHAEVDFTKWHREQSTILERSAA